MKRIDKVLRELGQLYDYYGALAECKIVGVHAKVATHFPPSPGARAERKRGDCVGADRCGVAGKQYRKNPEARGRS
jgi:hypothetical protein